MLYNNTYIYDNLYPQAHISTIFTNYKDMETKQFNFIVSVKVKNVYWNDLLYPNNEQAIKFARLLNKKTLSDNDLENIEEMGFTIEKID